MSKITKIPSYQTTDGKLHTSEPAAADHQDTIDLLRLLNDATGNTIDPHSRPKVITFILNNLDEVNQIVKARRSRKARFAKKSEALKAIPQVDETSHFRA